MNDREIMELKRLENRTYRVIYEEPPVKTPAELLAMDIQEYSRTHISPELRRNAFDSVEKICEQIHQLIEKMELGIESPSSQADIGDLVESYEFTTSGVELPCGGYILGNNNSGDFPVRELVVGRNRNDNGAIEHDHYLVTLHTRKKIESVTLSDVLLLVFLMRDLITKELHRKVA